MTTYTNIPKPSGTSYTTTSPGIHLYDDSEVSYNDPDVYYNGNENVYTDVTKPSGTSYTNIAKPT